MLPVPLQEIGSKFKSLVNAAGGLLVSKTNDVSEIYAAHKDRLRKVEVLNEIFLHEQKVQINLIDKIQTKILNSQDPEERVLLKLHLEHTQKEMNRTRVVVKSLQYITDDETKSGEIPQSWFDRFNEFAKLSNEIWREDLLAKALAKEVEQPGSVSLRLLWLIGTLEEKVFYDFAALLDISSNCNDGKLIPSTGLALDEIELKNCQDKDNKIGNLIYRLEDTGLIAGSNSIEHFNQGDQIICGYGQEFYQIEFVQNTVVNGIIYSGLGNALASFYEGVYSDIGKELFDKWIASLPENSVKISKRS